MKKILCIEDDPDIAEIIEMALTDRYQLMIITDAREVQAALPIFIPDLILIDNYIGQVQAADVIQEIKKLAGFRYTPFILCSGHADIQTIATEIGANAHLEKPFGLADLYNTLEEVLSRVSSQLPNEAT